MIVVVEGPSAAGKTTWAVARAGDALVPEPAGVQPPQMLTDSQVARFWVEVNAERWSEALRVEATHGIAVCDGDPLKLHYDYCLARVGAQPWNRFDAGVELTRAAIERGRLGVADVAVVNIADPVTLGERRRGDTSRRRHNFELHRQLGEPLRDWYASLDDVDPGRVMWSFAPELPDVTRRRRQDTDLFSRWMAALPRSTR